MFIVDQSIYVMQIWLQSRPGKAIMHRIGRGTKFMHERLIVHVCTVSRQGRPGRTLGLVLEWLSLRTTLNTKIFNFSLLSSMDFSTLGANAVGKVSSSRTRPPADWFLVCACSGCWQVGSGLHYWHTALIIPRSASSAEASSLLLHWCRVSQQQRAQVWVQFVEGMHHIVWWQCFKDT
jgi:hypothetical protein